MLNDEIVMPNFNMLLKDQERRKGPDFTFSLRLCKKNIMTNTDWNKDIRGRQTN